MKTRTKSVLVAITVSSVLLTPVASAEPKKFGRGHGVDIEQLPEGRVKNKLKELPAPQRRRAKKWLERFEFTERDLEHLNVDDTGAVFYADEVAGPAESSQAPEVAPAGVDTFMLHSNPGAANVIYLDFNGHVIEGTAWNRSDSPRLVAKPFDLDGNTSNFNSNEINSIYSTWRRVAEDFAPFDVDVTTEEPVEFGPNVGRALMTSWTGVNGESMPSAGSGGVAWVAKFGEADFQYFQPALVYNTNSVSAMADTISHEIGHNLGLSHDGHNSNSYYQGHGTGNTSWGPIMGAAWNRQLTQWSNGDYDGATNTQDDVAIIASRIGFAKDDHVPTNSTGTALRVDTNGSVISTNSVTDPGNVDTANKGIVEFNGDVDWFYFDTDGGNIDLNIAVVREPGTGGANVDLQATLYDDWGTVLVSSDPTDDVNAKVMTSVPAGRYHLAIAAVGNQYSPYSAYGSAGQFFVSGYVPASTSGPNNPTDTTAPTPNPMQFSGMADVQSRSQIVLNAVTATDPSGVEYLFECAQPVGCPGSQWQASTRFVATNLSAGTIYQFRVKARDLVGNETQWSPTISATTYSNSAPVATNDSLSVDSGVSGSVDVLANDRDPDGDKLVITRVSATPNGAVSHNGTMITYRSDSGFEGDENVTYTIADSFGATTTATLSITVSAGGGNNPDPTTNSNPVTVRDQVRVRLGSTVSINVLANDLDPDGDQLRIRQITGSPTKGSASISADGTHIIYTSRAKGRDKILYTVEDGYGGVATGKLILRAR